MIRALHRKATFPGTSHPTRPPMFYSRRGLPGLPKAVVVPHRAISRLVFGLPGIALNNSEIVLHFAPLNFDASTFEIWGSLLHGAKMVVHSDEFVDLPALGETLERHRVTTAWLTSSLFNQIIDSSPTILRDVRQVITGGEALSPGHVAKAQELLPETRFFNGYGPTETTTFATIYSIPRPFAKTAANVPIGRPIAGTQTLFSRWRLRRAGVMGDASSRRLAFPVNSTSEGMVWRLNTWAFRN